MADSPKKIKRPRGLPTRERIIMAAMEEFAEHGLAGARVDRIARRAAINKAMIYYHFSTKEDLYKETIAEVYRNAAGAISSFFKGDGSLEKLLRLTADYFAELMNRYPDFRSVLMREFARPRAEMIELITGIIISSGIPHRLMNRLQAEMKAGRIRRTDPRQLLLSFITMNMGYLLMAPLFEHLLNIEDRERFRERRKQEVVTLFLKGIRSG
jgi:TetR/AcrR family transcriptional regulator